MRVLAVGIVGVSNVSADLSCLVSCVMVCECPLRMFAPSLYFYMCLNVYFRIRVTREVTFLFISLRNYFRYKVVKEGRESVDK